MKTTVVALTALFAGFAAFTQNTHSRYIPQTDSSYIDAEGTAHVTRVVPVPDTISAEAKKFLARQISDARVQQTLAERPFAD